MLVPMPVSAAQAQTHSIASQFHEQVSLVRANANDDMSKAQQALREKEHEAAKALAKAEQMRLEALQYSKSLELSRKQAANAEAAQQAVSRELALERERNHAKGLGNEALEEELRTAQHAA